jgi:hypothetical protein
MSVFNISFYVLLLSVAFARVSAEVDGACASTSDDEDVSGCEYVPAMVWDVANEPLALAPLACF